MTRISDAAYDRAVRLARGDYQRGLLDGSEAWNGSTLRGGAKKWGSRYYASRMGLVARLEANGLEVVEILGPRGGRWHDVEIRLAPCTDHEDCAGSAALGAACSAEVGR